MVLGGWYKISLLAAFAAATSLGGCSRECVGSVCDGDAADSAESALTKDAADSKAPGASSTDVRACESVTMCRESIPWYVDLDVTDDQVDPESYAWAPAGTYFESREPFCSGFAPEEFAPLSASPNGLPEANVDLFESNFAARGGRVLHNARFGGRAIINAYQNGCGEQLNFFMGVLERTDANVEFVQAWADVAPVNAAIVPQGLEESGKFVEFCGAETSPLFRSETVYSKSGKTTVQVPVAAIVVMWDPRCSSCARESAMTALISQALVGSPVCQ